MRNSKICRPRVAAKVTVSSVKPNRLNYIHDDLAHVSVHFAQLSYRLTICCLFGCHSASEVSQRGLLANQSPYFSPYILQQTKSPKSGTVKRGKNFFT